VTLTLSCSGCSAMRFSNDNAAWSAWQTYTTTKAWTLTSNNGTKTVYAQFKDNAGNTSATARDDIIFFFMNIDVHEPWIITVAWHDPEMSGDFISGVDITDTDLPITGTIKTDNNHSGALVINYDKSIAWDFDNIAFYQGLAQDRNHASGTMTNIYGNYGEWVGVKQTAAVQVKRKKLRRNPGAVLGVKIGKEQQGQ
ncbi:MAG: hypothetical protein HY880_06310, partial [Deltaproteobacteria bacterium]|nr:hypothetical protein [Deltaproteobacteria bacterium]